MENSGKLTEEGFNRLNALILILQPLQDFYATFPTTFDNLFDRASIITQAYELNVLKLKQHYLATEEEDRLFGEKLVQLMDNLDKTILLFDTFIDDIREFEQEYDLKIKALDNKVQKEDVLTIIGEIEKLTMTINQKYLIIKEQLDDHELVIIEAETIVHGNLN